MKSNDISVHIRVNIDKENLEHFEELLDILKEQGLEDCPLNLGHVKAYTNACASIDDSCLNNKEFAEQSLRYQKVLHRKGFRATNYPYYPGVKGNYCCADSSSAYVIDPKGFMYKCWNDIGNEERMVGNVLDPEKVADQNTIINMNYLLWSPFEFEECTQCNLLPICMGGCPYNGTYKYQSPECENWKYTLVDVLKVVYDQNMLEEEVAQEVAISKA